MDALELEISDGVTLAVPATLKSTTTYVLLEQETWFEKETSFLRCWLQAGMTAIDIGANLGTYTLPMSLLVGRTGHVFAYEPGSVACDFLKRSGEINRAGNLTVSRLALSDGQREGRLLLGPSSELNALGSRGEGEPVHITSLDDEDSARGWPPPDFIKIDAEGEEERILAGARNFLDRYSPLVMFEVKAGDHPNEGLRTLFPAIGYRVFRQLGGAPILVPDFPQQPLDQFELNLFAAKPDRVRLLSEQGLLVDSFPAWTPTATDCDHGAAYWRNQAFASSIGASSKSGETSDQGYRNCLAAYAVWRSTDRPPAIRCAALALALRGLRAACRRAPTLGRLSTLARAAWESGARVESIEVMRRIFQTQQDSRVLLEEPFWPAAERFDKIALGTLPVAAWFAGALAEQYERTFGFSSAFAGASPTLDWLCNQPFASTEMERRRILVAARVGLWPSVPARLCEAAPDHLNADIWRAGKVPGTRTSG